MNKDTFSHEISKLISGYIEDSIEKEMDMRENPYHETPKSEKLALIKNLAKEKRLCEAVRIVLYNELFDYELDDFCSSFNDHQEARYLYNNIQAVYEELKALSTEDDDDKQTRVRCCY